MSTTSLPRTVPSRTRRPRLRPSRKGRTGLPVSRRIAPYVFVAPFIAIFLAFGIYPMLFTLRLSFTNWHGAGSAQWVGWDNYSYLLTNPAFWNSLGNSAILWLLIIPVQLVIALAAAILLDNAKLRARGFYRTAFIVPFVTPLVAVAQIWVVLFDQNYGAVNAVLGVFGLPDVAWLTSSEWAKPTLALLFIWKTTGFIIVILLSGLQSIDSSVYEAAALDGAGRLRRIWSITIPLIRRTLMFSVVLQTLAVFQMFAEPFVVTQGGPYSSTTTAGLYLYNHITRGDLGTGAANSFLLVILVMALSLGFVRLLRAKD